MRGLPRLYLTLSWAVLVTNYCWSFAPALWKTPQRATKRFYAADRLQSYSSTTPSLASAQSLSYFLASNSATVNSTQLHRILPASLRVAAQHNDYRTLLRLAPSCLEDTRLFTQLWQALTQTAVRPSKLRQLWKQRTCPVDAVLLNVVLSTSSVGQACRLVQEHADVADGYSLVAVLDLLKASVHKGTEERAAPMPNVTLVDALRPLQSSVSWQWNQALELISAVACSSNDTPCLTNPALTALLSLNVALATMPGHNTPAVARFLWSHPHWCDAPLDSRTCTAFLSCLSDAATARDWYAQSPNTVYTRTAYAAVCARTFDFRSIPVGTQLETPLANAWLQALTDPKPKHVQERWSRLLQVWNGIEAPDLVTFHTLLGVVAVLGPMLKDETHQQTALDRIAREMRANNLTGTAVTVKQWLLVAKDVNEIQQRLDVGRRFTPKQCRSLGNAALSRLAVVGGAEDYTYVLDWMRKHADGTDRHTVDAILDVLAADNAALIPDFLRETPTGLKFDSSHFSRGITLCISGGDFVSARAVLSMMQSQGMKASTEALSSIARSYALAVLSKPVSERIEGDLVDSNRIRAQSAYDLLLHIPNQSLSLLSTVSKACARSGLFPQSLVLLARLHKAIYSQSTTDVAGSVHETKSTSTVPATMLPRLHRTLLRECASHGNVTAALACVSFIQQASKQYEQPIVVDGVSDSGRLAPAAEMQLLDWKYVMTAASKSGHWRVCLGTLQFLRPYMESMHPASQSPLLSAQDQSLLAGSLASAISCLSIRSQYGWVVRALDDWMEWTGQRPPRSAVLSAFRILSARGRGDEVARLVAKCVTGDAAVDKSLYIAAITALHREGLYDSADDVLLTAMANHAIPLVLERTNSTLLLDLHDLTLAVAHSAVRVGLQQVVHDPAVNNVTIVTGRGRNSQERWRPILRPQVQRMLTEEFYPPLTTTSMPGNMGALLVPDLEAWRKHQLEQKGVRMRSVAAALRSLSGGLRRAVAQTQARNESSTS